ncbi:hypothetical protein HBI59_228400 [Parastagonospora nodorum]|nr:hypothetical protein HBI59_228400 [Parastagonospora nodorum]
MTLLRQTRERSSRDSICDAMTLTSDEYETLYVEIARVVALRQNSLLQSTAPNSRLRTITHLARRKMRCNYNSKTRLQNNDGYAEAVVYSAGQSNTFIRTLERETRIRISTEARWHSALQDTVATKLYRATFVIELLI